MVSRWWMVCAVCSAPSLSTPAQSEPPPPSDSANQLPEKTARKQPTQKVAGKRVPASNGRSPKGDLLDRWLKGVKTRVGKHGLTVLSESRESRDTVSPELREIVRDHYMSPEMWSKAA